MKEEKLLLMANYSNDKLEYSKAIKRVIVDCSLNPDFNEEFVANLPHFDTQFLFLTLRARSIGEVQEIEYTCNNEYDQDGVVKPCGAKVTVPVDFTKMELDVPEGHNRNIKLSDGIIVTFKYPSFEYLEEFANRSSVENLTGDQLFDLSIEYLSGLMEKVITQEGVLTQKDFSKQEAIDWLEDLTEENFIKIRDEYLEKTPRIVIKSHFKCKKCAFEQGIVLEGLESFFV
jgi:hypothetical protein